MGGLEVVGAVRGDDGVGGLCAESGEEVYVSYAEVERDDGVGYCSREREDAAEVVGGGLDCCVLHFLRWEEI